MTVLVTGAAGGIGTATVQAFLGAGFDVVGLDRQPAPSQPGLAATTTCAPAPDRSRRSRPAP
jgi:nucleoside-diphosphate-sugar epimerase